MGSRRYIDERCDLWQLGSGFRDQRGADGASGRTGRRSDEHFACPGSDSNRHLTVFETVASANWATGALCDGETSGLTRR